nr:MAG TPA: hypothetical protein [Microviridae sp.]
MIYTRRPRRAWSKNGAERLPYRSASLRYFSTKVRKGRSYLACRAYTPMNTLCSTLLMDIN